MRILYLPVTPSANAIWSAKKPQKVEAAIIHTQNDLVSSAILACKMSQHEKCALLGYYTAYGGNSLLMFGDNLEDGIYILEDGTDRLSQNVSREIAPHASY